MRFEREPAAAALLPFLVFFLICLIGAALTNVVVVQPIDVPAGY